MPLARTYTYTARSANDPRKVVTFTLHDDRLSIDVAGLAEQVERALVGRKSDGDEGEQSEPARPWLTPGAAALLQRATDAFHLTDVDAQSPNGGLRVTAWVRANNLRVAPVMFKMKQVDNPTAADDFVDEIERRKAYLAPAQRLPGPLDYWASWALGGAVALGALAAWLWPKREQDGQTYSKTLQPD